MGKAAAGKCGSAATGKRRGEALKAKAVKHEALKAKPAKAVKHEKPRQRILCTFADIVMGHVQGPAGVGSIERPNRPPAGLRLEVDWVMLCCKNIHMRHDN